MVALAQHCWPGSGYLGLARAFFLDHLSSSSRGVAVCSAGRMIKAGCWSAPRDVLAISNRLVSIAHRRPKSKSRTSPTFVPEFENGRLMKPE